MLSLLYGPTLTSIHYYWKTIALTRWIFVSKVMSLLFNMLSRFVIAFLPSSKHLLISWIDRISLKAPLGTFLVVQWLGLNAFTAVAQVQSLFRVLLDRALSIYIFIDISLGWLISYLFPYIRGIHKFCNAVIKKNRALLDLPNSTWFSYYLAPLSCFLGDCAGHSYGRQDFFIAACGI